MWTVAHDSVRQTVRGTMEASEDAVTAYVQSRLTPSHAVDFVDSGAGMHTVTIGSNESVMSFFGTMSGAFSGIHASVTMMVELK